jgi:hypothetical protein
MADSENCIVKLLRQRGISFEANQWHSSGSMSAEGIVQAKSLGSVQAGLLMRVGGKSLHFNMRYPLGLLGFGFGEQFDFQGRYLQFLETRSMCETCRKATGAIGTGLGF